MQITIHRGAHTIGGTCIEISTGDQRIIFDIGSALMEKGGGEIEKDPDKMTGAEWLEYRKKTKKIT